ncbi:hypothetical protein SBRCBS47491_001896 [Sporothrix bragantina]|uniref:DUF7924 domain-containing protein n=1 Tax=Sporothrix bragantina TaxID=671064 RepID=A0ABP0B2G0_9PEZI
MLPVRRPESSVGADWPVFDPSSKVDLKQTSQREETGTNCAEAEILHQQDQQDAESTADGALDQWDREILQLNNIRMRPRMSPLPDHIQKLVNIIRRDHGPSEEPLHWDDIESDPHFEEVIEGTVASSVEDYYRKDLFALPSSAGSPLRAYGRVPMHQKAVPLLRISDDSEDPLQPFRAPVPSLMFGYNSSMAFPERDHQLRLSKMRDNVAATETMTTLLLPFFVVEFRGGDGDMLEIANACMASAATCVNMVEKLNRLVRAYHRQDEDGDAPIVESASFSVATTGEQLRMYVTWTDVDDNMVTHYETQHIGSFLLSNGRNYTELRRMIRNIIDWGKVERLQAIKRALDFLVQKLDKRPLSPGPGKSTLPERPRGRMREADQSQRAVLTANGVVQDL